MRVHLVFKTLLHREIDRGDRHFPPDQKCNERATPHENVKRSMVYHEYAYHEYHEDVRKEWQASSFVSTTKCARHSCRIRIVERSMGRWWPTRGGVLRTIQSLPNLNADCACIRVGLSIAHALHAHRIRVGICIHKDGLAPGMLDPDAEVTSDAEAREVRTRPL